MKITGVTSCFEKYYIGTLNRLTGINFWSTCRMVTIYDFWVATIEITVMTVKLLVEYKPPFCFGLEIAYAFIYRSLAWTIR